MHVTLTLPFAFLLSALAIRMAMPLAPRIGLIDRPGGHKHHEDQVPLVGGLGIFTALVLAPAALYFGQPQHWALLGSLLVGVSLLFCVGLADDVRPLGVRLRFAAQGAAALTTATWGGLVLADFGALVGPEVLPLGLLALPMTVFATAGVINALNMIDGVDGLSGSLSLVSLLLLSVIAYFSAAQPYLTITLALLGAVGGFLLFNLRCGVRAKAAVFMGDAGSTVLGFLFACLFIGLSQGETRAMAPVIALWLFAVPLYDTTATMVRRIWLRGSPFRADRSHLHHLLLDAGFTVSQGVLLMSALQLLLGGIGLTGWYLGWPESGLFGGFLGLFLAYLFIVSRPWRLVPALRRVHRNLELTVDGVSSAFVGDLPRGHAESALLTLLADQPEAAGYWLYAYCNRHTGQETSYAIIPVRTKRKVRRVIRQLERRVRPGDPMVIRQFIPRNDRHDRRKAAHAARREQRRLDRRSGESRLIARQLGDDLTAETTIVIELETHRANSAGAALTQPRNLPHEANG